MAQRSMTTWDMVDYLKDTMGAEALLEEIILSLSQNKLREICEWIAKNQDISLEQVEDLEE